jgi:hypothetical protein
MSEASFSAPQAATAPATPLEVAQKASQVEDLRLQAAKLDQQISVLSDEVEDKRIAAREAFVAMHAPRFADLDAKIALTGGRVEHAIAIKDTATYFVSVPSSARVQVVETFIMNATGTAALKEKFGLITNSEALLLQWLVGVQLGTNPRIDLSKLPVEDKLSRLRDLPAFLVNRLADECGSLQAWLNMLLETMMGKS